MKKINPLSIGLLPLFLFMVIFSSSQTLFWGKNYGSNGIDFAPGTALDSYGNLYAAGSFAGTVDFDPGPGIYTLTANSGYNGYVSKHDALGNLVWVKQFEGNCSISSIAVDLIQNVYITGNIGGVVDFDPGPGTFTLGNQFTGARTFLCKLNNPGNLLWAYQMGANNAGNRGEDITIDAQGDVLFCGVFQGTADFNGGPGIFSLSSLGFTNDIFVCKYSAAGQFIWARQFEGNGNETISSIATDQQGNVYSTGTFSLACDFDPGSGSCLFPQVGANLQVFISKLDPSGNFNWAKKITGNSYFTSNDINIDASGNVLFCGDFRGQIDFDPGSSTYFLGSNQNTLLRGFVVKLNSSGAFTWADEFISSFDTSFWSLCHDANNNIYFAGGFWNSLDFDPGPGTLISQGNALDAFICKLDSGGSFLWGTKFDDTGIQYSGQFIKSIHTDSFSNIYVAGTFYDSFDLDPGPGVFTVTANGSGDSFLCKLKPHTCTIPPAPVSLNPAGFNLCTLGGFLQVVAGSYVSWYTSNTSSLAIGYGSAFSPPISAPGTYTYYAEANTCVLNPLRTPITFTVLPSPTLNISAPSTICLGQAITDILVSGTGSFALQSQPPVFSSFTSGSQNYYSAMLYASTDFTVTLSGSNGCQDTAILHVKAVNCTGIGEQNEENNYFIIYPNPSSGLFILKRLKNDFQTIYVFDVSGRLIEEIQNNALETPFSIREKGVYFIKAETRKGQTVKRIIVN